MKLTFDGKAVLQGAAIYATGDAIASWMLGEFTVVRLAVMVGIGASVYAVEIPNYFRWIDTKTTAFTPVKRANAVVLVSIQRK